MLKSALSLLLMLAFSASQLFAGPATACRHLGLLPDDWNGEPVCLDSWIEFNQGIWDELFLEPREFDPRYPAFALQEHWGQWKDPSSTLGANQLGDVLSLQVWFAEPIDWTVAQTAPGFPVAAFAEFIAAGGAGLIVTGTLTESFASVPIRGCLVSFMNSEGREIDLFIVTERVAGTAGGLLPQRGDPGGCICPGCPCSPHSVVCAGGCVLQHILRSE